MVVEDQAPLRTAICAVLNSQGYKTYEAENGKAALNLLSKLNYKVDLIITDVIMPEMGGQELAQRLVSLGHKIKLLYLSGFTGDVLVDHDSKDTPPQFLEKPFNNKSLVGKIRAMLS